MKRILVFLLTAYIAAISVILLDGAASNYTKANYAVVLGNQVLPTGDPSRILSLRLDKAIELYNNRLVSTIIVSGGFGKEGFDEALVMKKYLIWHQIPANKIITDSKGNNTRLTAENVKSLIGTDASIIIVSHLYHVSRCKLAFKQVGFKNIGAAYPLYFGWHDFYSVNRELFAWVYYYLKY